VRSLNNQTGDLETLLKKANILVELRSYKILGEEVQDEWTNISAEDPEGRTILFQCIPGDQTIGVRRIRALRKKMEEEEIDKVIVIGESRYSYVARNTAAESGIELIPPDFPSFNIFDHELVPKHEIMDSEEAEKLLEKFKVKPYQLPHIKADDTAVRSIGAKPGDILRITRRDSTAGEHLYYRYVV